MSGVTTSAPTSMTLAETLSLFVVSGGVVEIRIIDAHGTSHIHGGFFDNFDAAAKAIRPYIIDGKTTGIYLSLNEVNPDLLSRYNNRIHDRNPSLTTAKDVASRRWLLIDLDAKRIKGISATNQEKQQAVDKVHDLIEWLRRHGCCEPIVCDSGNGVHLLIPIDLPNDDPSEHLIKRFLKAVSDEFSDDHVTVDLSVCDAPRIVRFWGTPARKGDNTTVRPHRMSSVVNVPTYIHNLPREVCSLESLKAVASLAKDDEKPKSATTKRVKSTQKKSKLDVPRWLTDRGVQFRIESGSDGWTKFILLPGCLFDASHRDKDAMIGQHNDGRLAYKCFHNGCTDHQWDDAKAAIGAPDGDHYDPPLRQKKKRAKAIRESRSVDSAVISQDIPRQYDETDRNDIGNAEHFARKHRSALRYCASWQKWLCFDGARWKLDDDDAVMRLAKEVVREIFDDALNASDDEILTWGMQSANIARMRAMVSLASSELPIVVSDMNQDSWLLNCPNGTVDLKTGELKPHRRSQCITKLCPTEFHPEATSAAWVKFLTDVFVDQELIDFIRRLFGHFLTGDVSEQKLPIFFGTGSNGKSTLLNSFMRMLGDDYAMQAPNDFLMEKRGDSHPTEKASLFGKRFVSCVETEQTRRLSESMVKSLTGGEKIMARRMREDFWQFDPTHKIILATNHRPIVKGSDHGIWRRLLLIPFNQQFEGDRKDKLLPEKLLTESSGILAWAVRGCLEWQNSGLHPPASVTLATSEYRSQEDIIGRFVSECCDEFPHGNTRFSLIYSRFESWAEDSGEFLPPKRAVGAWLKEHGYEDFSANGRCYHGIKIKQQ